MPPIPRSVMPFGKWKGYRVDEVPADYLRWAVQTVEWLPEQLREEMEEVIEADERENGRHSRRRNGHRSIFEDMFDAMPDNVGGLDHSLVRDQINRVYREMSLRYHPDRGGSNEAMRAINDMTERLKELLGEI